MNRTSPLVSHVFRVAHPQQLPYQLPPLRFGKVLYATACRVRLHEDTGQRSAEHGAVYCLPSHDAFQIVTTTYQLLQDKLTALKNALLTLQTCRNYLAQTSERNRLKGRLSRFVVAAPEPDTPAWGVQPWYLPTVEWCWLSSHRTQSLYIKAIPEKDEERVATERAATGEVNDRECRLVRISDHWRCPSYNDWYQIKPHVVAAHQVFADWTALHTRLGTYTAALSDGRYGYAGKAAASASTPGTDGEGAGEIVPLEKLPLFATSSAG